MPGLLELGPMTRNIQVLGQTLTIKPVPTRDVIRLLAMFPEIVELLGAERALAAVTVGPEAMAHLIACATGELDKPGAVEAAMRIGIGKTAEIVEAIFEISFEDGSEPFMKRIETMLGSLPTLEGLGLESSAPWSASLVGDEPRKPRLVPARASS